jgi:CRP-like cAMP-binding protein
MAYYIIKLHEETGNVPMNQTTLARYIGKSRITLNKVIQKWIQDEFIELNNRQIVIKDMDMMKTIANIR